ncbi:putative MFS family arabinose efflux permease [Stackebrandtia albiflava]|uniref:Putative MFS family arabinose efflux permease n=1 Tax=Stackebrandtia albiflava TaxID=406432 RepID=A0A562UR51_9ACTN|nr:putative MFS family arabinose efflux permease [Stackebrandtia albiflava]
MAAPARTPTRAPLPRAFWYIWAALLVNKAAGFVVIVLMLYLTGSRHLSESQAGIVVGLFGAGGAAGVLIGGVIADRFGRKVTMVVSSLLAAAALFALGDVTWLPGICALVAVFGFANSAMGPAAIASMADVVAPEERDRAFNLMFWAVNVGTGLATLLAGFLAQYSYLLLFRLDAAGALITALIVLVAVPETMRDRSAPVSDRGRFTDVLRDRPYLVFVGLVFLQAVVYAQTSTTLPLAMTGDGLTETDYGITLTVGSVLITAGQLLIPRLLRRFSKAVSLAAALVLMGAGFGLVGLSNPFGMYLVCSVVWTIGAMLAAPPNATIIADLSPPRMRARYQGVFSLTYSAAAFAAPLVGGFTLQYLGDWHWALIAGVAVAGAVGHLWAGPARERATARRAAAQVRTVPAGEEVVSRALRPGGSPVRRECGAGSPVRRERGAGSAVRRKHCEHHHQDGAASGGDQRQSAAHRPVPGVAVTGRESQQRGRRPAETETGARQQRRRVAHPGEQQRDRDHVRQARRHVGADTGPQLETELQRSAQQVALYDVLRDLPGVLRQREPQHTRVTQHRHGRHRDHHPPAPLHRNRFGEPGDQPQCRGRDDSTGDQPGREHAECRRSPVCCPPTWRGQRESAVAGSNGARQRVTRQPADDRPGQDRRVPGRGDGARRQQQGRTEWGGGGPDRPRRHTAPPVRVRQVFWPTMPSTTRPLCRWKSDTAASVSGPKTPSTSSR